MTDGNARTPAKLSKPTQFVGKVANQADALAALNNVVEAGREYLRLREEETTKRARLDAYRTLESERIRAAERVLSDYFDHVFTERASNFEEMWSRLDDAAEAGDDDTVRNMLGGIVQLAQTSPLSGLADLPALRAPFDDPSTVWEL
jgi:hypothetical protein